MVLMDVYCKIFKAEFGQMWVAIFEQGKIQTPILLLYDFEFEMLIIDYQNKNPSTDGNI